MERKHYDKEGFCKNCFDKVCERCKVCQNCGRGTDFELAQASAQKHCCVKETQRFRIQNDADWRAKLDFAKTQVTQLKTENERLKEQLAQTKGSKGGE